MSEKISLMPPFQVLLCQAVPEMYDALKVLDENPYILWNVIESLAHSIPTEKYRDMILPQVFETRKELNRINAITVGIDEFNTKFKRSKKEMGYLLNRVPFLYDLMFVTLGKAGILTEVRGYGIIPVTPTLGGKSKKKQCPKCNTQNNLDAKFCSECGDKFG
jgi:hypothetical protein